jgi:hypothetical protein
VLSIPSSWVPNWVPTTHHQAFFWRRCRGFEEEEAPTSTTHQHFSGTIAGEKEDFYKGSLSRSIFYFVIVLLYFIFSCIVLSKIQKN